MTGMPVRQQDFPAAWLIIDHAPVMLGYLDRDLRYRFANDRYVEVLGKPLSEILGKHVLEVLGPVAWKLLEGYTRRALGGERIEYSHWVQLEDGRRLYLNTSYQPDFAEDGVCGFFIYVLDMTEKQLALEALQKSERLYLDLFENSAVSMAHIGPDGQWLDINEQLSRELGYAHEELLSLSLSDIAHPEDFEQGKQLMAQALRGELDQYQLDQRFVHRLGHIVWGHVTASVVRDGDGELVHLTLIIKNITARKEAESALHELNLSLESRIEERTAELSALNQELDAFNYSVSHDLRAPLRGIDGFSYVLLEEYGPSLDERARHYLGRIRAGAHRLGALLDALLLLSSLTRSELSFGTVDLSELAAAKVAALREEEPERNVRVEIEPELYVRGDENLLRIVMRTILENAWKFTRYTADALITVGSERRGDETVYFVRDNGAGFDPLHAGKLFLPFQSLHSPNQFSGHGIGLATVQRIIHRHNGHVWAEGAVDEGATFFFTLQE